MPHKTIDPKTISVPEVHGLLLGSVAPRPIAFASTIDSDGNVNLSPFSFFNVFSANPPILIFSPARRGRDNTTKHTLDNVHQIKEVAISIVNFNMVQQMSLASSEYARGVNEFNKGGLKEAQSEIIRPPFVAEAPVSFECIVNDVVALGDQGGAGNLVICEVQRIHIDESILDESNKIDPQKLDSIARMGGNWYCRAHGESLFEVPKPLSKPGIGVDALPDFMINSEALTGNDLGLLGGLDSLPAVSDLEAFKTSFVEMGDSIPSRTSLIQIGRLYLEQGDLNSAYCAFANALDG